MSCRSIVTSPAKLVDEYAQLPIKIVVNARIKRHHRAPKSVMLLALSLAAVSTTPARAQNAATDATNSTIVVETATTQNLTTSDVLIVLDTDGRSHTVQHTVATNGDVLTLLLPGSVIPQEVMFFGPERDRFAKLHKSNPSTVELSSGSAFARYQHQYGVEVQQVRAGHFVLTTASMPTNLKVYDKPLSQSSISWVFPNEFELVSYSVTDYNTGRWVSVNNILTFHNTGNTPVELSINYKKTAGTLTTDPLACSDIQAPSDACADDNDEDGVPDYRDICVSNLGQVANVFGCATDLGMILHNIEFTTGRTYLDVAARHLLDKVAYALLKSSHSFYEIGAHTDNAGASHSNQQLSQKRADAVRHYLMLKGVDPNALRAAGYGEAYPVRDNASADGRRANRRVELVVIK